MDRDSCFPSTPVVFGIPESIIRLFVNKVDSEKSECDRFHETLSSTPQHSICSLKTKNSFNKKQVQNKFTYDTLRTYLLTYNPLVGQSTASQRVVMQVIWIPILSFEYGKTNSKTQHSLQTKPLTVRYFESKFEISVVKGRPDCIYIRQELAE